MSDDALAEWARSIQCLHSADLLLGGGDADGSASRSYYASFHAVSAFFLTEGRQFKKHEAVETAVHRDLVHARRVGQEFGESFSVLRNLRVIGDYGMKNHVSAADAADALARARQIAEEIRRLAKGALP